MKLNFRFIFMAVAIFCFTACKKDNLLFNQVPIADAGTAQTIQLPSDSAILNGSGKDNDGHLVAYLWSEISGPNMAMIVNNGSPSTRIKNLTAGLYVFQLMVVDNRGATGVDTVSVTVITAKAITLSLQPDGNPTEVHIYGNNNGNEGSWSGAPEFGAVAWTQQGEQVGMRALLKFDFSSIPSSATIISAKLTLYSNPTPLNGDHINANSGPDNTMFIERVTSSWVPDLVRWTNQPTSTATNHIIIPHTNQGLLNLVDIDVSQLVTAMVSSNSNNGFFIRLKTEAIYNSRIFCSSKYADIAKHPKIVIVYE